MADFEPPYLHLIPFEFRRDLWCHKTRVPGLSCGIIGVILCLAVFRARCNIYISRLCYDVSVRLSVRLSVTEVHCSHGACPEHSGCASQRSWSHHTILNKHGRRRCCGCWGEGSSRVMLATAKPSCYTILECDRQTHYDGIYRVGIASRGKNCVCFVPFSSYYHLFFQKLKTSSDRDHAQSRGSF